MERQFNENPNDVTIMTESLPQAIHRPSGHDNNNNGVTGDCIDNNKKLNQRQPNQQSYLIMSNTMRSYIESLPKKLTITEELMEYRYWKSLRTEFISTFLFVIFTCGILTITTTTTNQTTTTTTTMSNEQQQQQKLQQTDSIELLKNSLAIGFTVATLIQCTGHVCGCHLTIAITIGLYVTERVTILRLISYLFVQIFASIFGMMVVYNLFGTVIPIMPSTTTTLTTVQIFGFEFLSTFLIVLTYLANCDPNRRLQLTNNNTVNNDNYNCIIDSSKSLTIGFAYTVGHLFAFVATGASMNPAKALAISIITENYCLHWIYWISPLLAGLFGGLIYDYIGSIKTTTTTKTTTTKTMTTPLNCPSPSPSSSSSTSSSIHQIIPSPILLSSSASSSSSNCSGTDQTTTTKPVATSSTTMMMMMAGSAVSLSKIWVNRINE
uniref:Aquaporin-5-like n=1 Tax=Dermatophagoides pteronyssinus TaxID=6956 RepID=A0A6P6YJH6_DERPT|nr:aquaporin-5-like [Dermatophagoides pteronyssinus]